jgi:hypothetical protein
MKNWMQIVERAQSDDLSELKAQGYDINELLYHGSTRDLEDLQTGHGRTAHIYTSPDPRTASYYGGHIHVLVARHGEQADLTHPNHLTRQLAEEHHDFFIDCHEVEERIAEMEKNGPLSDSERINVATEYTETMLLSGLMWERPTGSQTLQDRILDEVFKLGYTSARINDVSLTGSPLSVVFPDGSNLKVIDHKRWSLGDGLV